jgi:acetyltransferase-like isoleucine patch superfamily enzyme
MVAADASSGLPVDHGVRIGYPSDRGITGRVGLGADPRLRSGTVLYAGTRVGDRFQTGHNVVVREETWIGDDVSVWSNSIIDYGCVIGDRVKIHAGCYVAQFTDIADDVFLAPGVVLTNDLYPGLPASAAMMRGPVIEAGAQVGANVTVLPYVRIGRGAIVGAGSVVTRDVPPRVIAYGSPAVAVRPLDGPASVSQRLGELAGSRAARSRERGR